MGRIQTPDTVTPAVTRARLQSMPASLLAAAAAITAVLLWIVLALATGLIYHLMPAAPPLAAGVVLRWTGASLTARHRVGDIALASAISIAAAIGLAGGGHPLDAPWATVLSVVAGAGIAVYLLRPSLD